jgi:hypothetical protein
MYIYIFIDVSAHIYISIYVYTVFIKKNDKKNMMVVDIED